ncbi:transcriptional regulator [Pluralibacter gergoviae]
MAEINAMINSLLAGHSQFSASQLRSIVAFVNELDEDTLYQFENAPEREVMAAYDALLAASTPAGHGPNDIEMQRLTGGDGNSAIAGNSAFFRQYRTSATRYPGYGGNIYSEQAKLKYDYAGKVLAALGGLASAGAGVAAIVAASVGNSLSSQAARYALIGVGGVSSLAGGALAALRNVFADLQVADNKQFLETVKSVVKTNGKLAKFFEEVNNKVLKDPAKAQEQLKMEIAPHPQRYSQGSQGQVVYTNLTGAEQLFNHDFHSVQHSIRAKIRVAEDNAWHIEMSTARIEPKTFTPLEMEVMQRALARL